MRDQIRLSCLKKFPAPLGLFFMADTEVEKTETTAKRRTTQADITQEVEAIRLQGIRTFFRCFTLYTGANLGSSKEKQDTMVIEANGTSYECSGRTGKGSFGVVYKAVERGTGKVVAIKRVLQDPRYKVRRVYTIFSTHTLQNRELQIMKMIKHPNCVELVNSFYERTRVCESTVTN